MYDVTSWTAQLNSLTHLRRYILSSCSSA